MSLKINIFTFLFLTFIVIRAVSQNTDQNKILEPYVSFISSKSQEPVDYILDTFNKSDIIILCERHHDEFTQYEMINDLISNERFFKQVGHIFTEIGTSTNNEELRNLLFTHYQNDDELDHSVLNFYRDLSYYPLWEKYPFYYFLLNTTKLNNSLPIDLKINVYFTDLTFSWQNMTREKYKIFKKSLPNRDLFMAQQIIKIFNEIKLSQKVRKKALVIMNYRHAFNDYQYDDGRNRDNVGRYLFEEYKGSISNIMINSLAIIRVESDQSITTGLVHKGKWDAAFEIAGNPNIGFDFSQSPFGEESFDYYPLRNNGIKYKHVFTGYIFYKPIHQHRRIWGIPNISQNGFGKTMINRYMISGIPLNEDYQEQFLSDREHLREFKYENIEELIAQKDSWLEKYPK